MDSNGGKLVLTRDVLLQRVPQRFVALPSLGDGGVYLRVMSGHEMACALTRIEESPLSTREKDVLFAALLVLYSACYDDGSAVFGAEDEQAILNMERHAFKVLSDAAMDINGFSEAAAEELKKSTEQTAGFDSGISLPSLLG